MVDAAIVVVEQTIKAEALGSRWSARFSGPGDYRRGEGSRRTELLLLIADSFMPTFASQYQEGTLFKPLAFTKNFSMPIAAVLAITLDPAIRLLFMRTWEVFTPAKVSLSDHEWNPRQQVPQQGKPSD